MYNNEEREVVHMRIDELLLGENGSGGGGNGSGRLDGLKVEFRRIGGMLRCLLVYL